MKIALTTNTSWNIHNFRVGLVNHLRLLGHEVYLIAPDDAFTDNIGQLGNGYFPIKMQNTGSNPIADFWLMLQLLMHYRKIKPDVILHYTIKPNIYGTFAARLLGIPVINNVSGLGTIFLNAGWSSKIAKWLYYLAFRGKTHIFFQNYDDLKEFNSHIKLTVSHSVIPGSGIDLAKFAPAIDTPKNDKTVFLFIGRLLIDKGVMEYIAAARNLLANGYPAIFQIAGELDETHVRGVKKDIILAEAANGTIDYLGHVSPIGEYIAKADWIVLPSYREGTSRILLEAAAMGKPIVTTDVPGCNNVVKHGKNGYLCAPRDESALEEALLAALQADEETVVAFGKNSREIAEQEFDEKLVFKAYLNEISRLVAMK